MKGFQLRASAEHRYASGVEQLHVSLKHVVLNKVQILKKSPKMIQMSTRHCKCIRARPGGFAEPTQVR